MYTLHALGSIGTDVPETWIRVNWMLHRLHAAAPHAAVTMFLDCCREVYGAIPYDPPVLVGDRSEPALVEIERALHWILSTSCPPSYDFVCSHGYVLVFASEEGNFAREHKSKRNGYFTSALLHQLDQRGHVDPLSKVLDKVSEAVRAATDRLQKPAVYRTAKEDVTLVELLGYRPLPSAGIQASLREVVLPLCDVFARQVCFMRGRCKCYLWAVLFIRNRCKCYL